MVIRDELSQYYPPVDIVNGPGTRCALFVSGCVYECPGCYNKSTWRLNSGMPFTAEMEDRIINDLNDTRIKRRDLALRRRPAPSANVPAILLEAGKKNASAASAREKTSGSGRAVSWMN